jgi:signal peptidase II
MTLGVVVDFLDVYVGENHWPAFNIADSAICVGVFFLLFYKPPRPASSTSETPVDLENAQLEK